MENEYTLIRMEQKNRLVLLTLQNPPDQYLTHELLGELQDAMEQVTGSPDTLALLFASHGGIFSRGFFYPEHGRELTFSVLERFRTICAFLLALDFPTVAVVDGEARNWGADLLFFFDTVIASDRSTLVWDNLALGTFSPLASMMLADYAGEKGAYRILSEEETLDAEMARQIGLFSQVVPRESISSAVKTFVGSRATRSSAVGGLMARNMRRRKQDLFDRFVDELFAEYLNVLGDLDDYSEGLEAHIQGRPPSWLHR